MVEKGSRAMAQHKQGKRWGREVCVDVTDYTCKPEEKKIMKQESARRCRQNNAGDCRFEAP